MVRVSGRVDSGMICRSFAPPSDPVQWNWARTAGPPLSRIAGRQECLHVQFPLVDGSHPSFLLLTTSDFVLQRPRRAWRSRHSGETSTAVRPIEGDGRAPASEPRGDDIVENR